MVEKTGVNRSVVNRVIQGRQPPTKVLLNVLELETVYVPIKKPDAKAD
jgi:hypothetical protein